MTQIVYLIGKPGVGKYTIAKELRKSGFIVCDNQLVNSPIFTLLNYDGYTKIPEKDAAEKILEHSKRVIKTSGEQVFN